MLKPKKKIKQNIIRRMFVAKIKPIIFAQLRIRRVPKIIRLPNRAMSLGTRKSPIIETIADAVYRLPIIDSGILVARKDELMYTVSAV